MNIHSTLAKFTILFSGFILSFTGLQAQVDTQDIGSASIAPYEAAVEDKRPFKVAISADYVGKGKVKRSKHCPHLGDLTFATGQAEVNFVFYYQECYEEGAAIALAYDRTYMNWDRNPYFHQKDIDTVNLILSGFSKRLCDWDWRAQLSANFDNIRCWEFRDYMNYDILLWGRYDYCENIGLHIGFWAQTGMKFDRVYPVIGIDWQYNCNWKFNLIFPVNISAVYTFNPIWSIALAGRFFDQRHRVCKDQRLSAAFYHYQTSGAELALNYTPSGFLSANIHAGYDFGGHLTIRDRHFHHARRLQIESAPYVGAEIDLHF